MVPAIRSLLRNLETINEGTPAIHFVVEGDENVQISEEIALNIYRVLAESLNNILAHANAQHLSITIKLTPTKISFTVSDDGCGFSVPQPLGKLLVDHHFGLVGMRERIEYLDGQSAYSNIVEITVNNLARFRLYQNYPNPFNGSTNISFDLTVLDEKNSRDRIRLHIFDLNGRKVKTLYDSSVTGGSVDLIWEGTDENGTALPSGIYFYKLEASDFSETKRLLLLK